MKNKLGISEQSAKPTALKIKSCPKQLPEFTNLLELNLSNNYKAGHSLLASLYAKYTDGLITRYQYKGVNTDPARTDSVIYNSYANANKSYSLGLELTARNQVTKWWDITSNLNLFDVTLRADNIVAAGNSEQFSWFAKLNKESRVPDIPCFYFFLATIT